MGDAFADGTLRAEDYFDAEDIELMQAIVEVEAAEWRAANRELARRANPVFFRPWGSRGVRS